ncbi:MAG: Gfo/Idh/MocA family oxidoreductase [Kiritimatiellia bacterium]|jgi:predicted dehydrogenase|nr:Gfo/Idh/MocA family oxidoreductase [Kiritimatiellia bacterium]MDP6847764.1 Gfo/Idh/MocA family oxidoreductase [Kiritimatiellia bacterium]
MHLTRRGFLKGTGAVSAAAAFPTVIPSSVLGENAPSKRITLGCIGMGGQGVGANLNSFLNEKDAQILATCDAYQSRAERTRQMVDRRYGTTGCKAHRDFRKIIDDPSIDAVVISTPDHWHVPMSMMALQAGKDVFCEKPTLYIDEGRRLMEAVKKHKAVFQVGLEDRSLIHFHKMVEWVKNGAIGRLGRVDVTLPGGLSFPKEKPVKPPEDLDWNLWQGPARFHEYTPRRTGGWHWRNISDYAKGAILDMGAHLVDTAQVGVNAPGGSPVEVEGTGEIPEGMETDVPIRFDLRYRYANGVEMTVKNGPQSGWKPNSCFIRFEGDKGWVRRKTWSAGLDASNPEILRKTYTPETSRHWPLPPREQRNFLDCVKSRKPTTYQASDLHLVSTTLHMGVIAITLGRKLSWDTKKEVFLKDDDANSMRKGPKARDWAKEA